MKLGKLIWLLMILPMMVNAEEKPKVITTTTIAADIAKNIAGEFLDVESLVPVGGDPHLYEPIPQDAVKIEKAALVLKNGLTLEGWLDEFIENSGTKAAVATVTANLKPLESAVYEGASDPHAWMDAENGIIYAENTKNAFAELFPEHKEAFETNFEKYKSELEELEQYINAEMSKIPDDKRILITSHDAFQYYGRKYNIRLESILGISTDADAQTSDVSRLYKIIRETKVPAVFVESTVNPQMLKQIAKDTGVRIGGKLYADSLGEPDKKEGTYIGMMKYNTDVIVEGLMNEDTTEDATEEEEGFNSLYTILIALLFVGGFVFMFRKLR